MSNEELHLYNLWLKSQLDNDKICDKKFAAESFSEGLKQSVAYQSEAIVNGVKQPIVATRTSTNKCNVIVAPGDKIYIGDIVEVFNEHWLCVGMYIDEFDMCYCELWMCNHLFVYQDFNLNKIQKHGILDDGSYSNGSDSAIKVTENKFNCYVSLDDESKSLFIDKRLSVSVIYDKNGNKILEVGKIKWIDVKSKNFGVGSHLMVFGINEDPYNPSTDNIDEMICDYKEQDSDDKNGIQEVGTYVSESLNLNGKLEIVGKNSIKSGSVRTYTVFAIDENGTNVNIQQDDVQWKLNESVSGISIFPDGLTCKIKVKEDDNLVGESFELTCSCVSGDYEDSKIIVEVT